MSSENPGLPHADKHDTLRAAGWEYDPAGHVYPWRDPYNLASHYATYDALKIQAERDARKVPAPGENDVRTQ